MDSFFHIQGHPSSPLAPLILIYAVLGFALPYLSLGPLSSSSSRPIYGLSCPIYESKSYRPPTSFAAIAHEYVERIRKEIPNGPYILGGWSLGGMVAIEVAEILESGGEEVVGVVLIDSVNPEGYPAFADGGERREVAEWTYRAYAGRSGLPGLEEMGAGDEGGLSKGDDRDSKLGDQDADDYDDDDDEVDVMEYLPRMRKHIYNSLDMLARAGQGAYLSQKLQCPVTLLKCTRLALLLGTMSRDRRRAIRSCFEDERAGWLMDKFRSIPVQAQHDDAFDSEHVGEDTDILKGVLGEMR